VAITDAIAPPATVVTDGITAPATVVDECATAPDSAWANCVANPANVPVVLGLSIVTAKQGTTVSLAIIGSRFTPASTVQVSGTGITVQNVVVQDSGTITCDFVLDDTATVSARNVTVTSEDGTSDPAVFTVTAQAATLEMVTQPAGAEGGLPLSTQPVVRIRFESGNLDTRSGIAVTATVDVGTLSGTTSIDTVAGVATFTTLTMDDLPLVRAGNRVLTFASAGVTSVSANAILCALGNDHVAWYRADDVSNVFAGANLSSVFDRTGHGNALAATGTITKTSPMLNGKDGLDFSAGGPNYLANLTIGVQGSFTWFGVFKITASVTYQNLFDCLVVPVTWLFWDQPTNKWQLGDKLAGVTVAGSFVTLVVHYINNGSQVQVVVRANGVQLLNTFLTTPGALIPGSSGSPSNKTFPQFNRPPATLAFKSQLLEWGFYSKSKNGVEAALEAYLRAQYATW
jgi:hypothetical protein